MKRIIIELDVNELQMKTKFSDIEQFKKDLEEAVGNEITGYRFEVINVAE